jgi:ubiquinone/menaquinone biosynthesis C-methylase UbiE
MQLQWGKQLVRRRRAPDKHASELDYWRGRLAAQGDLATTNALYERYFTGVFDIPREQYAGQRMLDVGCGPRGSLEWADQAAERVGLDPLADEYVRLHAVAQAMTYVAADCERIPYPDGHFDVVSTFNSIDHVDDVGTSIAEITRVAAPGGMLLLFVDVNHDPTPTEPHRIGWDFLERFAGWHVVEQRAFQRYGDNMYDNIFVSGVPYDFSAPQEPGVLTARLERAAPQASGKR